MTRVEALEALQSHDLHLRLQAARLLAQTAVPADNAVLRRALGGEKVLWVRTALKQAIGLSEKVPPEVPIPDDEVVALVSPDVYEQIRTIAVNETTRRLVHEMEPILAALTLRARTEIADYDTSRTRVQVERLQELARAVDHLSQAAVAPSLVEFDLAQLIRNIVESEKLDRTARVGLAGPTPLLVLGDPALVELVIANGLRNAVEAVESLTPPTSEAHPVVVNWGDTARDVWVAILDRGPGPPLASERAFDIGSTTKENHLGMGLATARQAARSMSGDVSLAFRAERGGARFELRWPKLELDDR